MPSPRSVPLMVRRADARDLAQQVKEHRKSCQLCSSEQVRGTCGREKEMRAELAAIRDEIRHWFDPPADAPVLF